MEEWEEITDQKQVIKTAKMDVGAQLEGEILSIDKNPKYPDRSTLVMRVKSGDEVLVYPSGSLSYNIQDGKLEVGKIYLITRLPNKTTPNGASRTQFKVLRKKADGAAAGPEVSEQKPARKK